MTRQEQIDKIRARISVTEEEAGCALDKANGEVLDALILLEKEQRPHLQPKAVILEKSQGCNQQGLGDSLQPIANFINGCFRFGVSLEKENQPKRTLPLPLIVLFLIFFPWLTISLTALGWVLGYKYNLHGEF